MGRLVRGALVTFEGLSRAEAGRSAQELRQVLLERVGQELIAEIEKDDPDSQDAGSSLVLLFGTAAAVEIAKGIRAWLARRSDIRDGITIRTADGTTIVATGEAARSLDAAALLLAAEHRPARPRSVILFLAANPRGTSQLALDEECAAIERELKPTEHRDDFEFHSKWAVSVDELARHVLELKPTVIHFSGHGTRSEGGGVLLRDLAAPAQVVLGQPGTVLDGGGVVLRDEAGVAQVVPGRALAMVIQSAAPAARVVVLNACYGDAQADALLGVVDCVVGMTGQIGDEAARSFAVGLYRALGNRRSMAQAVAHSVAMLAAKQFPDEVLPRCRSRDGVNADRVLLGASR